MLYFSYEGLISTGNPGNIQYICNKYVASSSYHQNRLLYSLFPDMTINEYNSCVDQHADGVYRFILKNIKNEDKARDVVQDAFEKMWLKVKSIDFEKSKSYLFTTAYHTMIDYIRRDNRYRPVEEGFMDSDPSEERDFYDLKEILNEAMSRLPDIQRSVLLLRDYEGYSYQEIGEITNLNESQVKVYIYRARLAIKNYIGKPENVI